MAGRVDSPLYGMFAMRGEIAKIVPPGGGAPPAAARAMFAAVGGTPRARRAAFKVWRCRARKTSSRSGITTR